MANNTAEVTPVWAPAKRIRKLVDVSSMTLLRWAKAGDIDSRKIESPTMKDGSPPSSKKLRNSARLYRVQSVLDYIENSPKE